VPAAAGIAHIAGTLIATSFGFVVVQLDVTIVNVAMPHIGRSFASGMTAMQWVVDAYTLTFAAFLLTAGALGDRFGSRRAFDTGLWVFGIASMVCSVAPSSGALIAARAGQGAGAALILPTSLALLTHACADDREARTSAIGWWTAIGGVISAAGPVCGGILTSTLGWRSIFFVNIPICIAGLIASKRHVEETPPLAGQRLDWPGQPLAIAMFFVLTWTVIEAGSVGWSQPAVLYGLGVAALAAVLFVAVEARVEAPMFPLRLLKSKVFSASIVLGILLNVTFYGSIFVLSLYFQHARHYTPTQTGLALAPFTVIMLANLASGKLARRFSPRATVVAGFALSGVAFWMLDGIDGSTPYPNILPALLLLGIGAGIGTPSLTSSMLGSVDKSRAATASAVFNTARQVGSALGVAIFGALLAGSSEAISAGVSQSFRASALLRFVGAAIAAVFL
jgi:EmrB/QacA subfamily drug resistance transporter